MLKWTTAICFCCAAVFFARGAYSSEGPDALTQEIWQKIQGRPNPRIMDDFEVLEGFPLLVQGPGNSVEATVLTASIEYQIGLYRAMGLAFKEAIARAKVETNKTDREINDALSKVYPKKRAERETAAIRQAQEKRAELKTDLVRHECIVEVYVKETGEFMKAIDLFRRDFFLDAAIETEEQLSWESLKEAIDKKVPVFLGKGESLTVAVGYFSDRTNRYVLVYDPKLANYRVRTGKENVTEKDLRSKDPAIQKGNEWLMKQEFPADYLLSSNAPVPDGLHAFSMDQLRGIAATMVYQWKENITDLYSNMLATLGVEAEEHK